MTTALQIFCCQQHIFPEKTALGGQEIKLQRRILKCRTKLAKFKGSKSGCDPKQLSEAEPGSFFVASSNYLSGVRKSHLSLLDQCFSFLLWQSESPGVGDTEILILTGKLSEIQEC